MQVSAIDFKDKPEKLFIAEGKKGMKKQILRINTGND
jgi:hypothetical protein